MARTLEVVDDLEEMEASEGLVERVKDGRYIAEAIVFLVGRLVGLIGGLGLGMKDWIESWKAFDGVEDVMFLALCFVVEGC